MIKIGITGGETKPAGELLRLAMHHPDVEVLTVHSPANAGRPLTAVHHGFIGEEKILFTSNFDASGLDIAFLLSPIYTSSDWAKLMADHPRLHLVLTPESAALSESLSADPVYGLSEMNRKQLVRGARMAMLPGAVATPVLIALFPLASHLMLPNTLSIKVEIPEDLITDRLKEDAQKEISGVLGKIQSSFTGTVDLHLQPNGSTRGIKVSTELDNSTDLKEIIRIYDSIYDDHNFTFLTTSPVDTAEVEGTQKVIVSFSHPTPGRLRIEAVADVRMRGGAGDAIHIMNLFFQLHEKTGLQQKVSRW